MLKKKDIVHIILNEKNKSYDVLKEKVLDCILLNYKIEKQVLIENSVLNSLYSNIYAFVSLVKKFYKEVGYNKTRFFKKKDSWLNDDFPLPDEFKSLISRNDDKNTGMY